MKHLWMWLVVGLVVVLGGLAVARDVAVKGYTKKDGTYVAPHYRSAPDGDTSNNWSTKGNVNPYTGQEGTKPMAPRPSVVSPPAYSSPAAATPRPPATPAVYATPRPIVTPVAYATPLVTPRPVVEFTPRPTPMPTPTFTPRVTPEVTPRTVATPRAW